MKFLANSFPLEDLVPDSHLSLYPHIAFFFFLMQVKRERDSLRERKKKYVCGVGGDGENLIFLSETTNLIEVKPHSNDHTKFNYCPKSLSRVTVVIKVSTYKLGLGTTQFRLFGLEPLLSVISLHLW